MKEQLWVKWKTRDEESIRRIRQKFNIINYTTINGLSPAEIDTKDMPLLEETARRGFISILREKWCTNGVTFSFNSRKKSLSLQ